MPVSVSFIKRLEAVDPQLRSVLIAMLEEIERQREESVTKKEFNELRDIVKELAVAQKKTEIRIDSLAQKVEELAEAQRRTEAIVEELAEAQKKTEARVNSLAQRVEELAEAQKKTEARVDSLAQKVEELAEAQRKTEEEIRVLVRRMDAFEDRLEGISHSVGYSLENRVYGRLPSILRERYGIEVDGRLVRKYVPVGNKNIQVNIYGYGKKDGKRLLILGECKVRPSRNEIRRFEKYAEKIGSDQGVEIFPIVVAHDFPPAIEEFLREEKIPYIWSYELED